VIRTLLSPFRRIYQWLGDLFVSYLELRLRQPPTMPPVVFREATLADSERCMELYMANEQGRFPKEVRSMYAKDLEREGQGRFVVQLEGRIVATCQASCFFSVYLGVLSYGLIDPMDQRRGIGTAMLLFRLVLISRKAPGNKQRISMVPVDASVAFYRRFGFWGNVVMRNAEGIGQHTVSLVLTPQMAQRCEAVLGAAGIAVPPFEIPVHTHQELNAMIQAKKDVACGG
jgi:ribosomal protein S18 acetylase RimI-like enzyme